MNKKAHWESVYKEKSPLEVSWHQKKPTISLALIKKISQNHTDNIIDVGGGASTLADFLLEDGFNNITVLDLSSNALAHAKQRLGDKSTLIEWTVEDVTNFVATHKYDIWHDRAVFHFLTAKDDRDKYKEVLESSINTGGCVIIAAFSIGGPQKCSGLDIVQYDAVKLKNELGNNFTLIEEQHENHITPAGKEQEFGYYVFAKNA
ncbi:MAG: class I SAM-dependent methyltransferase [Gammaproteobacteria bacterium]|nr:class I SAM-dependent methyltransferase [Gammaproteobacteria bacterium]